MPKTVEYTGTQTRWSELATTGKQSTWMPGQAEERSDAEAVQLLGTGFFKTPDDTLTPSDIAGIKGVVSQAGKSTMGAQRLHLSMPLPPAEATGGTARTFDVQIPAKRSFKGVRFMLMNLSTTLIANYSAIRCGASPKHLNAFGNEISWWPNLLTAGNPALAVIFTAALTAATSGTLAVGWAGATGTYNIVFSDGSVKPATLTNGGTAVSWTGAVTATATATAYPNVGVPLASPGASASYPIPGFLLTDNVPLQPVARTDRPAGKSLVRVRCRSAAEPQFVYSVGSAYGPAWNAYVGLDGMVIGSYMATSDFATAPPTDNTYTVLENGGYLQPVIALFAYDDPGTQVWVFGDSLPQGNGSSVGSTAANGVLGWPTLVHLQQATIDCLNMAVTGQQSVDSFATARRMVAAADDLPSYVALKVYSPNDGAPTQALTDAVWGRLLELCSYLRTKGVTPVLFTSPPVNAWTAGQHAFNEAQNARAFALSAAWGIKVVDMATIVSNPANRRQILPAYDYGDGTHLLDAGHQAVANAFVAAVA